MTDRTVHAVPDEWKDTGIKLPGFALAEDALLFLILYPAMVTLLGAVHTANGGLWQPLLLLAGVLATTLFRQRVRSFALFLLLEFGLTGGVTALSFIGGGLTAALIGGLGMAVAAGVGIHRFFTVVSVEDPRYDPETAAAYHPYFGRTLPVFGTLILWLTNLVSLMLHADRGWLCVICLLMMLGGYAAYGRRRGESALVTGGAAGSGAFRRLNRQINWLIGGLIGVGGCVLYALYRAVGLDKVDRSLADWLLTRPSDSASVSQASVSTASRVSSAPQQNPLRNLPASHNAALAALGGVVKVATLLLAAGAIIGLLAMLAVTVMRLLRFHRTEDSRVVRAPVPAGTETGRTRRGPLAAVRRMVGSGNRVRIRRIYARMVRQAIRAGIKIAPSDTPAEIAEKLGADPAVRQPTARQSAVRQATALYEKARYAAGDCTRQDVETMKRCAAGR